MNSKDILTEIIIPLIAGFLGGTMGDVVIKKHRSTQKHKMNNKKTIFDNNGDVVNGNKK